MDFRSRLKYLRTRHKLTQEQLGQKINVTKVSISGYESGNRTPDTETLQKIADIFEVSVDYLLGRTDDDSLTGKKEENENLFFFDLEGLSEEDIEAVKKHIESLRLMAKQYNKNYKKDN